jgi:hypothetical protein
MRPDALLPFVAASALLVAALPARATPDTGPAYPRILNCYAAGLRKGAPEAELRRVAQSDLLCGGVDLSADAEIARVRRLAAEQEKVRSTACQLPSWPRDRSDRRHAPFGCPPEGPRPDAQHPGSARQEARRLQPGLYECRR